MPIQYVPIQMQRKSYVFGRDKEETVPKVTLKNEVLQIPQC